MGLVVTIQRGQDWARLFRVCSGGGLLPSHTPSPGSFLLYSSHSAGIASLGHCQLSVLVVQVMFLSSTIVLKLNVHYLPIGPDPPK